MQYSKVLVRSKSPGISEGLTYQTNKDVHVGSIVQVPLRNRTTEGIVLSEEVDVGDFDVKCIKESLSEKPLLFEYQLKTAKWMSDYYLCSLRQAISPFLPSQKWSELLPQNRSYIRLLDPHVSAKGSRQRELIEYLQEEEWLPLDRLRSALDTPLATIRRLEQQGVVTIEERPEDAEEPYEIRHVTYPNLTSLQKDAYKEIMSSLKPSLLFGVTGSGKTEVYAQLIADAVEYGKQAILLVPEILLTEHSITRFQDLLPPERIAVIHSRLNATERKAVWRRCRAGHIDLVIGSRSALFSPLERLGVVIIDEEHEWTYKNEQTPRYHARETAEALCGFSKAKLILGSATPSIESWTRAKEGRYQLVQLEERYGEQSLPTVSIIDLADVHFEEHYPFSPTLLGMIHETLQKGEQTILFLNRRGHASALLCFECRRRVVSPDSLLPFTVHKNPDGTERLVDHTTNLTVSVPKECPHCNSKKLLAVGAGTQKIEDILERKFPNARLLRADSDSLTHPEHMRLLLKKMKEGQADILFGTQSVAKGLDLPNVTLAAVLIADIGLSLPHFRAGERIFQSLIQLTGRSGRAKPGKVVIQTFRPDCSEVQLAAGHQTEKFLTVESELRKKMNYPPHTKLIRLLFRGVGASKKAELVASELQAPDSQHSIHYAPTLFGGGKVWHVLIRGHNPKSLLNNIDLRGAVIDVDPIECI